MLFTVGYEQADPQDFVATLKHFGIEILADVREVTVSRRRGFSKNQLRQMLFDSGIEYVHYRDLGDPKPGRDAARAGDLDTFRRIFGEHMRSQEAQAALKDLSNQADQKRTCLMCYERDPIDCHRSIVARCIAEGLAIKIQHIGVQKGIAEHCIAAE